MTQTDEPVVADEKIRYRTKDLNQAAFLWAQKGVKLVNVEGSRSAGNTLFFVFELDMTEKELQDLQFKYANGECLIEPNTFVNKQSSLRDLLHSSLSIASGTKQR